ncbi:hypothetical protein [Kosakonia oryzendophytica]|uniref:hypothetical protein n=1 Tax=Kosakonia oryzendophytica TaxID=1005665 RepID=UPI000777E98A|nr:hypothetical protein [Kosakonia oryzendophytica]WBT57140.1 hypothetical protein O9K67_18580 [Kosakonia oryzendophytica]
MEKEWIIPVSKKLFNDGTFLQLFHQNGVGDESNVVLFCVLNAKKAPFFNGGKGEKFVRITVL